MTIYLCNPIQKIRFDVAAKFNVVIRKFTEITANNNKEINYSLHNCLLIVK